MSHRITFQDDPSIVIEITEADEIACGPPGTVWLSIDRKNWVDLSPKLMEQLGLQLLELAGLEVEVQS